MNAPIVFNFKVDSGRLRRAIETPDNIGAVIRLHFEIDRALDHIVSVMVPAPQHINHQYLEQRIRFLLSLGIPEIRLIPARIINRIRNDFAHREKDEFLDADIAVLSEAIEALLGNSIPTNFALINKQNGGEREWRYGEMNSKEKFCFLSYFALSGIATIENDFEKMQLRAR